MRLLRLSNAEQRISERRRRQWQMSELAGYAAGSFNAPYDVPVVGGIVAAEDTSIKWSNVFTGLATGVSVWFATRMLDKIFRLERK